MLDYGLHMTPARPWDAFVRLGIVHFMADPRVIGGFGPVASSAAALCGPGDFGLIEAGSVHDAAERAKTAAAFRAAGVAVGFGCQPLILSKKLDPGSPDPATRMFALEALRVGLAQARDLGAESITVMSGPDPGPASHRAALDALVESCVTICREAAPRPVHLEVFDFDVDKKAFIGPTARAVELAERVRGQVRNFGLLLDLSHLPLQHERTLDSLRLAKEVLTHVHAGNCVVKDPTHPRYGDQHPRFGIEGGENGDAELTEFIRGLFEIGYLAPGTRRDVSFEVKPGADETTADLVAHTLATWARAWATARP